MLTNSPLLVWVQKPVGVQFVLPVHAATGSGRLASRQHEELVVAEGARRNHPVMDLEVGRAEFSRARAFSFWSRLRASATASPFFF